jgi:hypothetical protein
MSTLGKLTCPLAVMAAFAFATTPAHAQFEGGGEQMAQFAPMMEQFAPMMQHMAPMMQRLAPMMNSKMGRKYMNQMMLMAAPMMASMTAPGGGDFGSFAAMPGIEGMAGMLGDSPPKRARRRAK